MCRSKPWQLLLLVFLAGVPWADGNSGLPQEPATQEKPLLARQFPKVDRFGDPLPAGALFRLGTERFRQRDVNRVVYSPDGKILASLSQAYQHAVLWDAANGKKLLDIPEVYDLVFAADSQSVAVRGLSPPVRVLDVKSGREKFHLPIAARAPFAFSQDDVLVTAGQDGRIRLWHGSDGKAIATFADELNDLHDLAFSASGKEVVSVDNVYILRAFQRSGGKKVREISLGLPDTERRKSGPEPTPFISQDGQYFCDAGWRYFSVKSGNGLGRKNTLRIWNVTTGKKVAHLPGVMRAIPRWHAEGDESEGAITSIALSPDGKTLAYAQHFNIITLVNVATGKSRDLQRTEGREDWGVAFSPDGKTLAAAEGHGHAIRFWDVASGQQKTNPAVHTGDVYAIAQSPDGRLIATGGRDYTIKLWDRRTGDYLHNFRGPQSDITGLCFAPDRKRLASISHDGLVCFWNLDTKREDRDLRKTGGWGPPKTIAFPPGGETIAAVFAKPGEKNDPFRGIGEFRVWETATGKERFSRPLAFPVYSSPAAASADGRWLALAQGRFLILFQPATGKVWEIHDPPIPNVRHLAFSASGEVLAVGDRKRLHLFDTQTRQYLRSLEQPGAGLHDFAFSPDGRYLAGRYPNREAQTTTIRVWELASETAVVSFTTSFNWDAALVFDPDGRTLFSAGGLTTTYAWGLEPVSWRTAPPVRFDRETLGKAWTSLAEAKGERGYEALWHLAAAGNQAVTFLKEHLTPAAAFPDKNLSKLLDDLDHKSFKVRDAAMAELRRLGLRAEGGLQQALAKSPSLEGSRRIKTLLAELQPMRSAAVLRQVRAVQVLERVATSESRQLLKHLAGGVADARLTREARRALGRVR